MAKVTILVNGSPLEVDEVTPGLFGQLGYQYAGGAPKTGAPTSTVFTPTNLSPAQPAQLPPPPAVTSGAEMLGVGSSGTDILNKIISSLEEPSPAAETQDTLQKQILEALEGLGGKTARTQQLEEEKGIPKQTERLQELVNQLTGLDAEAKAIPLDIQEEFEGRGATRGGVEPHEAGRVRQNTIKRLGISAEAQMIQGNIALAQAHVDRAIALEFEPKEAKLAYLKQVYDFNKDALSREDKVRADKLNILLNERERILTREKEDKQKIYDVSLAAAQKGADSLTVQKIQAAKDSAEALKIATEAGVYDAKDELLSISEAKELKLPYGTTVKDAIKKGIVPGTGDSVKEFKFSSDDETKLLGSGFTKEEIEAMRLDINKYGLTAVLQNITSPQQKKDVQGIFGAEEAVDLTPILDIVITQNVAAEGLKSIYSAEKLKELATAAGYTAGGFLGIGTGQKGIDEYLNSAEAVTEYKSYITSLIEQYKAAGIEEDQIMKLIGIK